MNSLKDSKNEVLICIPTFNSQNDIEETLNSILNQSFENFDILVLDNFSNDETYDIVQKYSEKDSRIHITRNEVNLGRIGNWNKCLELYKDTQHKYFKFVFAGDTLEKECLEKLVAVLKKDEDIGLVVSGYYVHADGVREKISFKREEQFKSLEGLRLFFKEGNWVGAPISSMFSRNGIGSNVFFEGFEWTADWRFYIDIVKDVNSFYLPEPLSNFFASKRKHYSKYKDSHLVKAEELYMKHYVLKSIEEIDFNLAKRLLGDLNKEKGKHLIPFLSFFEISYLIAYKFAKKIKSIFA